MLLIPPAGSWNSPDSQAQIYTFQEFYTDAQYGADFGYYSKGRILHVDGSAGGGAEAPQDWFNSYTTLPMSLSPDFADVLADRLATMWLAMDRASPVVLVEFGGGTGMLARDVLRRIQLAHGGFYEALAIYVIGERSQAMREAQRNTCAAFLREGKLAVVEADARSAAGVREMLEAKVGRGESLRGFVLSNELLDEFDPVRLRLSWSVARPPTVRRCAACSAYREAYVLHRIDHASLRHLLEPEGASPGDSSSVDTMIWEGKSLPCGLLAAPAFARSMAAVAAELTLAERAWCAPMVVCCLPFLLAINQALQYTYESLHERTPRQRDPGSGTSALTRLYRHHMAKTNGTVPLSKDRYRELRRIASARGPEVEKALLIGSMPSVLPGRVHTDEVFLALSEGRCRELKGWMSRHAERLAVAARIRGATAWIYDGDSSAARTTMHLKLVVRPGEAEFAHQSALLIDEGFLVTLDYGADADALAWQSLIRPNYEGVHTMDARDELADECTMRGMFECPGLQDLTTSADFTEVAEAGRSLGGWEVLAYGPIFLMELAFDQTLPGLAPPGDPTSLGHLVERAGGLRTTNLQAWYHKPESDPWASFKFLVQHRGMLGRNWSLGPLGSAWPLQPGPRLFRFPSPLWAEDLTKPPLAGLIASAAHLHLGDNAWATYSSGAREPAQATAGALILPEAPEAHGALLRQFQALLVQSDEPLAAVLDRQHAAQQQAYADAHLALILVDYWRLVQLPGAEDVCSEVPSAPALAHAVAEVRAIADSRRLPELYGEEAFSRVLRDLNVNVFARRTLPGPGSHPTYVCLASRALFGRCRDGSSPPHLVYVQS